MSRMRHITIIENHAAMHEGWSKSIAMMCDLRRDQFMHWCQENEDLEAKRKAAELAVEEYQKALGKAYFDEQHEISEMMDKIDRVNLSNLFKKKGV